VRRGGRAPTPSDEGVWWGPPDLFLPPQQFGPFTNADSIRQAFEEIRFALVHCLLGYQVNYIKARILLRDGDDGEAAFYMDFPFVRDLVRQLAERDPARYARLRDLSDKDWERTANMLELEGIDV